MRVLIITSYGGWGSTGKITDSIAKKVEENGSEAWIAYGFYDTSHHKKLKLKTGARYMSFYEIFKCRLTGYMGYTSKHATKKLIGFIERYKPDVINLHNAHGGYIHIEMLFDYLKKASIPICWTIHDCWSFTGHCAHYQYERCDRWKTGCFDCPERKLKQSYPISYYFDRSIEQYQRKRAAFTGVPNLTIITPSQWLADQAKQSFLKEYPVKVVHNGIDLNVFKPINSAFRQQHHCENKKIVLGVAFGWGARKGMDVFIQLAERLSSQYQIVLVGTNDKLDRNLPKNIISVHRTYNQQELAEIYSAADVFVNPTRQDTFPTVNIEALACGTPIVTFETGGSPEILDETCGIVVPCDDVDAMEKAIRQVCEETPFSQEACLKRAKCYNRQEKFQEYVELFKKIATEKANEKNIVFD